MELRGYDLRYLLTSLILDHGGSATTAELRRTLVGLGVVLGPDPRRRLYGARRSEVRVRRLRADGNGCYEVDDLPRSTRSHIGRRVAAIRAAIEAGAPHPPPQHRYPEHASCRTSTHPSTHTSGPDPTLDDWPIVRSLDDLRLPADQPLRDAQIGSNARREEVGHGGARGAADRGSRGRAHAHRDGPNLTRRQVTP